MGKIYIDVREYMLCNLDDGGERTSENTGKANNMKQKEGQRACGRWGFV